MTNARDTATTITDDRLDQLHARLDALEELVDAVRRAALAGTRAPSHGHRSAGTRARMVRLEADVLAALFRESTREGL